jgi:hypothetical protein
MLPELAAALEQTQICKTQGQALKILCLLLPTHIL